MTDRRDGSSEEMRGEVLPTNRPMSTPPMIPVLVYPDVSSAIRWLCDAFGFTVQLRTGEHRAELNAGAEVLVVAQGDGRPERGHALMIYVADVDAHCAHATARGARLVNALATFIHRERQYSAIDPWGHVWTFSQSVADGGEDDMDAVRA